MKKVFLLLFPMITALTSFSQDSTGGKWTLSLSMGLEPVPVYQITGTDTGFVNSFSVSPGFTIRHSSGFGLTYSPKLVMGGASPGIYMHALTAGIEQYDKEVFNYSFNYSHYFFTNTTGVPYSPINNEISGSVTYKKTWLRPSLAAGVGFGNNTETTPSSSAYDIGASFGLSHAFSWDTKPVSYSLTPSLALNGGTNQYFSLLSTTKYIGRSKKFTSLVSNSKAAAAAARSAGRRAGTGSTTSTTTTTTVSGEKFSLSNLELGLESSVEMGSFTIRPEVNFYIPVGTYAGSGLSAYWGVSFVYSF